MRTLALAGLSAFAALSLSACGAGVEEEAPAAQTQVATPNPRAPAPEPGQTNAQARAEVLDGNPDGVTPQPEALEGATAADVNAPRSPAQASQASGGGPNTPPAEASR
jgi:hypothetical protein